MVEDAVIAQEAPKMGITVSDAELNSAVEEFFGYYANGTPTPTVTPTPYSTATLSPTQLALVPPTATPTETQAPTEALTPTENPATPTLAAETATPTANVTATPEVTWTPLPTSTPYTQEGFTQNLDNYVASLKEINFTQDELRQLVKAQVLRDKVYNELTKDVPDVQEQVWARHILVPTEEEANKVIERLNAGEDFAAIAKELSQDSSNSGNGGDLGWFTRDTMVTPFAHAAFSLKVGEISKPVQTTFGWHVI